ncbi:unnamed protein product, partial [Rhizoctonia solani]
VQIAAGDDFSETSSPNEVWFAVIVDIKCENKQAMDLEDTFVEIHWFYTPYNLERYYRTVGNLRTCRFGKNEVVLSNHSQVIPAVWIVRKVRILCFNEEDKSNKGDYIGPRDRWYRYHFKIGLDRIMTKKDETLPSAGCLPRCGLRYSPDEEVQRFCPRWLCRKWWHEECLRNLGHVQPITPYSLLRMVHNTPGFRGPDDDADDETPVDRKNNLENDHPENDEEFETDLAEICKTSLAALVKLERDVIRVKDFEDKNLNLSASILRNEERYLAMEKVLWCARSPIVRGKEHGIVGTGELVTKARNFLKSIADDAEAEDLPEMDPDTLSLFASCELPILPIFSCPECGGAI